MATVNGTNSADTLYGTDASDTIKGLNGDDVLKGFGGADRLDGGNGSDTVMYADSTVGVGVNLATGYGYGGTAEGDTFVSIENVYGSGFNDSLTGNDANNTLYGLGGNDILKGGGGGDLLYGGDGDDSLKGGGGADLLDGGAGIDTADYSQSGTINGYSGVQVDLEQHYGQYNDAAGDLLFGIENVTGSAYNDRLFGDGGVNVLRGLDGDDELNGRGGADVMVGGRGSDTYIVDNPGDSVVEYNGEGHDVVYTTVSYTLAAGSEIEFLAAYGDAASSPFSLTGNEFANTIWGGYANDVLNGGAGADYMAGGSGDDIYIVDNAGDVVTEVPSLYTGFDRVQTSVSYALQAQSAVEVLETTNQSGTAAIDLVGNELQNTIIGNDGQNTLVGGFGLDTLIGNGGGDVFVWSALGETGAETVTADIVGADFNPLVGDLLAFNPIDADGNALNGNQAFTFVGTAAFTAPGQINWFTDGVDTYVQLNTDADAKPEAMVRVLGLHVVDAGWFVL